MTNPLAKPKVVSNSRDPRDYLNDVINIITERGATHGDNAIAQNADVARRWNEYIASRHGVIPALTASDVCLMMCELKQSRLAHGGWNDEHLLDQIGYLAIALAARSWEG